MGARRSPDRRSPPPRRVLARGVSGGSANMGAMASTQQRDAVMSADRALGPLAELSRWIAGCEAAGGESLEAGRHIEDALAALREEWSSRDAGAAPSWHRRSPPWSPVGAPRRLAVVTVAPAGTPLGEALERLARRRLRPRQDRRGIAAALRGSLRPGAWPPARQVVVLPAPAWSVPG